MVNEQEIGEALIRVLKPRSTKDTWIFKRIKGSAYSGNWGHRGGGGPGKGGSTGGTGLTVLGLDSDAPLLERRAEAQRVRLDRNFEEHASWDNEESARYIGGGVAGATLVEYEGDGRGVYKWQGYQDDPSLSGIGHDGNAEVAASRLDVALGLGVVPKTVYAQSEDRSGIGLSGNKGTSQRYVEGAKIGFDLTDSDLKKQKSRVEEMMLLDFITDNRDRHDGNWLIDRSGRLWAIDNGHAKFGTQTYGRPQGGGQAMARRVFQPSKARAVDVRSHKLSPKLYDKVNGLTRDQFDQAMGGIATTRNVDPGYAWQRILDIQATGELTW